MAVGVNIAAISSTAAPAAAAADSSVKQGAHSGGEKRRGTAGDGSVEGNGMCSSDEEVNDIGGGSATASAKPVAVAAAVTKSNEAGPAAGALANHTFKGSSSSNITHINHNDDKTNITPSSSLSAAAAEAADTYTANDETSKRVSLETRSAQQTTAAAAAVAFTAAAAAQTKRGTSSGGGSTGPSSPSRPLRALRSAAAAATATAAAGPSSPVLSGGEQRRSCRKAAAEAKLQISSISGARGGGGALVSTTGSSCGVAAGMSGYDEHQAGSVEGRSTDNNNGGRVKRHADGHAGEVG